MLSSHCESIYQKKSSVCFGISPFNSYFSEERIAKLARWGKQTFRSIHFFIPDIPSVYTLEAQGYSQAKAVSKARQQSNYLRNKFFRALSSVGLTLAEAREMLIDWGFLGENSQYHTLHKQAETLFESDLQFRSECIQASKWVMAKKLPEDELTEEVLLHAVKYFLAELPLFADSPGIIGIESSMFAYHQSIPFLERLYQRKLPFLPARGQGFVVLESEFENAFFDGSSSLRAESSDDARYRSREHSLALQLDDMPIEQ